VLDSNEVKLLRYYPTLITYVPMNKSPDFTLQLTACDNNMPIAYIQIFSQS